MTTIYCKRYHMSKKNCDIECDVVCQLNKKGGTKVISSLHNIIREFPITANQVRCTVRDGIIHAEIVQRGSRKETFFSKDEVVAKLDQIRTYPKKSAEELERYKNNHMLKYENNITENFSDDLCPLSKASLEFKVSLSNLHNALEHGIIHSRQKNGVTKYLVSRSEIRENLELIKKGSRIFYRLLNMKKQHSSLHQLMNESVSVPVDNSNLHDKCQVVTA